MAGCPDVRLHSGKKEDKGIMTISITLADSAVTDAFFDGGWRPDAPFAGPPAAALPPAAMDRACSVITAWPEYRPSPLRELPALAARLGIGEVWCKDESGRFGVGGVKALGAPYGLSVLLETLGVPAAACTAVAATDGNHGLALGWAARRFGCTARIFVGRDVDAPRLARIRSTGAEIEIVDGTYDDAVLAAERLARSDRSVLLVTDTDYDGDKPVCQAIMAGYAVLAEESWRDTLEARPPTHVFLQCGVGGLAGGVAAGLWRRMDGRPPRVVTVEPADAACLLASLRAGRPAAVSGSLRTRMAGLACGRPTLPAWEILSGVAAGTIAISDIHAEAVQGSLASGDYGDPPLAVGDTGIAGIAGLIAAAAQPELRKRFGLDGKSRILVVNSEGPLADSAR